MTRRCAALIVALGALTVGCGPLIPLPPAGRPDGAVEPADGGANDALTLDASVCVYPLRVGCTGAGGCMGYRECDPTETFLGPCTCYPDAGWDRPPPADRGPEDAPRPDVVEAGAEDAARERDVVDAGGAYDAGLSPAYCIAHPVGCTSNRECEACGATPGGVAFCCSTMTTVCLLRSITRGCMP